MRAYNISILLTIISLIFTDITLSQTRNSRLDGVFLQHVSYGDTDSLRNLSNLKTQEKTSTIYIKPLSLVSIDLQNIEKFSPLQNNVLSAGLTNAVEEKSSKASNSFFKSDLFYFVGAAALAVLIYISWPKNETPAKSSLTFGLPVTPK